MERRPQAPNVVGRALLVMLISGARRLADPRRVDGGDMPDAAISCSGPSVEGGPTTGSTGRDVWSI